MYLEYSSPWKRINFLLRYLVWNTRADYSVEVFIKK